MDALTHANQVIWDAWTASDKDSDHARDAARVAAGGSSLRPIERAEVSEVSGKTLLHLLCNRGSDTLSWARLGARVTGVDFSGQCIAQAHALALTTGLPARFLQADLYALPEGLDEQFDIVFMSYGVLCWMPDLPRWAEIAAQYVGPDGVLYLVDMHPFAGFLTVDRATEPAATHLDAAQPYYHAAIPQQTTVHVAEGTGENTELATLSVWSYSLGEVVSAIARTGLQVEFLHEHPATFYRQFPLLVEDGDGLWRWPEPTTELPLLFSVRASKAGSG
jgi:2-polyprenyl-3-methyl-5-hydroxy-6-metoxy-1,4-benzoquinol methylase